MSDDLISRKVGRMNHDYEHCADYTDKCPKKCFRGELVRDLKRRPYPLPVSWMHLEGTVECRKERREG